MLHSSRLQFLLLVSAVTAAVDAREQPTLAYLFTLRRARHPLPHAWANYFAGCPRGSYKIHIHVDPMFNGTAASEIGAAAKYFKQDFVLPRDQLMKVRRFGHELVLARMKLVRHALADKSAGGTPRFLSFFSESCAPISTCMRAHAYLASGVAANKSFIDDKRPKPPEQLANNDVWKKEAAAICPKCEAAGILPHNLRYSPGWVTLWHGHAADLVANEQLHHPALTTWGWSKLVNMIPDESYWSTLANKFGHQITGDLTTYMEPGDPKTGHSKLFRENDVDRLWRTPAPNFFARKFPTTPRMDAALAERIRAAKGTEKANRQRR